MAFDTLATITLLTPLLYIINADQLSPHPQPLPKPNSLWHRRWSRSQGEERNRNLAMNDRKLQSWTQNFWNQFNTYKSPTASPSLSSAPSESLFPSTSDQPSAIPSSQPTVSGAPTQSPSNVPSDIPSSQPTNTCPDPPNLYRTCFQRAEDPNNDLERDIIVRNDFNSTFVPYFNPDMEELVFGYMHLALVMNDTAEVTNCEELFDLEEFTLKYLNDNVGNNETFIPVCVYIGEVATWGETILDSDGNIVNTIQTMAFETNLTFVFEQEYLDEIESNVTTDDEILFDYDERELQTSPFFDDERMLQNRGTQCTGKWVGTCCSTAAITNNVCNSKKCKRKGCKCNKCPKPKSNDDRNRFLLQDGTDGTLNITEDFFGQDFTALLPNYTIYEPTQTDVVVEAEDTSDVASCSANRYASDASDGNAFACEDYATYECAENEDIDFDEDEEFCASASPSMEPSVTLQPTRSSAPSTATWVPTGRPSVSPSKFPSVAPTISSKSSKPTATNYPTFSTTTYLPTTHSPTTSPTSTTPPTALTGFPTFSPTWEPTESHPPTFSLTFPPTIAPTINPALSPTDIPTFSPTFSPTTSPVSSPIAQPSTNSPSKSPGESTPNPTVGPDPLTELYYFGAPESGGVIYSDIVVPHQVDDFLSQIVIDASAGTKYTLLLLEDGTAASAGYIDNFSLYGGHLGIDLSYLVEGANAVQNIETVIDLDGNLVDAPTFKRVFAGVETSDGSGRMHSVFIDVNGNVHSSGNNNRGQLCLGDTFSRSIPTQFSLSEPAISAAVGAEFTLILGASGKVYGCGSNEVGQLGFGSGLAATYSPANVGHFVLGTVMSISAGIDFSLFRTTNGLYVTGGNSYSQLCLDTSTVPIFELTSIEDVIDGIGQVMMFVAGAQTSFMVLDGGTYVACGRNDVGQIGDSSFDDKIIVQIGPPSYVDRIWAGPSAKSTFFRGIDGNIYATGLNSRGNLGVGDKVNRNVPTEVAFSGDTSNSIVSISASDTHTLARSDDLSVLTHPPSTAPSSSSVCTASFVGTLLESNCDLCEYPFIVAVDGDTAATAQYLGSFTDVHFYSYENDDFTQSSPFDMTDDVESISISGNFAVVGAPLNLQTWSDNGTAYLFENVGGNWLENVTTIIPPPGIGADARLGRAVSIFEDVMAISAPDDDYLSEGAVYMYRRNDVSALWVLEAKLNPDDDNLHDFGKQPSLKLNFLAVGDNYYGEDIGAVFLYEYSSVTRSWQQWGEVLTNTECDGQFGYSVALTDDLSLLVGCPIDDNRTGSVYYYTQSDSGIEYILQQKVVASDGEIEDYFGDNRQLAVEGNVMVVGTWKYENGAAYVFTLTNGVWTEVERIPVPSDINQFGSRIALSGNKLLVSSFNNVFFYTLGSCPV